MEVVTEDPEYVVRGAAAKTLALLCPWTAFREPVESGVREGSAGNPVPVAASSTSPHPPAADCGIGMTLSNTDSDFFVEALAPGGQAAKSGVICLGDLLQKVDGRDLVQSDMTLETLASLVRGPAGSTVELQFLEQPKRTTVGQYRVRLVRQAESGSAGLPVSVPPRRGEGDVSSKRAEADGREDAGREEGGMGMGEDEDVKEGGGQGDGRVTPDEICSKIVAALALLRREQEGWKGEGAGEGCIDAFVSCLDALAVIVSRVLGGGGGLRGGWKAAETLVKMAVEEVSCQEAYVAQQAMALLTVLLRRPQPLQALPHGVAAGGAGRGRVVAEEWGEEEEDGWDGGGDAVEGGGMEEEELGVKSLSGLSDPRQPPPLDMRAVQILKSTLYIDFCIVNVLGH
jgi:hypothetical protein